MKRQRRSTTRCASISNLLMGSSCWSDLLKSWRRANWGRRRDCKEIKSFFSGLKQLGTFLIKAQYLLGSGECSIVLLQSPLSFSNWGKSVTSQKLLDIFNKHTTPCIIKSEPLTNLNVIARPGDKSFQLNGKQKVLAPYLGAFFGETIYL